MKIRLFSLLALTALLISLLTACTLAVPARNRVEAQKPQGTSPSGQQTQQTQPPAVEQTELTASAAEDIALAHAGLAREEVTRLYTQRDYDDGIYQYEIQFWKDRLEYEYEIHAETGRILSFDKDYD